MVKTYTPRRVIRTLKLVPKVGQPVRDAEFAEAVKVFAAGPTKRTASSLLRALDNLGLTKVSKHRRTLALRSVAQWLETLAAEDERDEDMAPKGGDR